MSLRLKTERTTGRQCPQVKLPVDCILVRSHFRFQYPSPISRLHRSSQRASSSERTESIGGLGKRMVSARGSLGRWTPRARGPLSHSFSLSQVLSLSLSRTLCGGESRRVATCMPGKPGLTSFSQNLALYFIQSLSFRKMNVQDRQNGPSGLPKKIGWLRAWRASPMKSMNNFGPKGILHQSYVR